MGTTPRQSAAEQRGVIESLGRRVRQAVAEGDWGEVVACFEGKAVDDASARLLRLARNMLAWAARDPLLAGQFERVEPTGVVRLKVAGDGMESFAIERPGGSPASPASFIPASSPAASIDRVRAQLAGAAARAHSVALVGVGDGHMLSELARETPDELGRQRLVLVIEPDAEVFRTAMMLHDWSGFDGPILGGRFMHAIGDGWRDRFESCFTPDARLVPPKVVIQNRADATASADALRAVTTSLRETLAQRRRRVFDAYARVSPGRVAERLAGVLRGGEPARVMLLTTRYSTVLQHSTRDMAEGFERVGCEVFVEIEDEPWENHTTLSLAGGIDRFRPDLVVQIDHHRNELPGLFPEQVPFICIVQDNLYNLMSRRAGAAMGPSDFAAGPWVRRYVRDFGYPADRCIELPRLTRRPSDLPAVDERSCVDLMYVSNHSTTPEQAVERAKGFVEDITPAFERLIDTVGGQMIAHYETGGTLENSSDVELFVARSIRVNKLGTMSAEMLTNLAELFAVHVNNALYRRQGLRWAAQAAEAHGLSMAIYGRGWEDHPEFGCYARGVIDYETELMPATRAARFCLMLEPYHPTSHQRSLDTWMWGGFMLIRRRPRDAQQAVFNAWIDKLPAHTESYDHALELLGPEQGEAFGRVYEAQRALDPKNEQVDLVALYTQRHRDGVGHLMAHPPGYGENSFDDGPGFARLVRRFLDNPKQREAVRREQAGWVRERFSYEHGARRLLGHVSATMNPAVTE